MTRRKSYQRGNVQLHNGEWTLRYREYNHATRKWTTKRERLGKFKDKKTALRAAEPIMARVNERNNKPPEKDVDLTFGRFVETTWKAYTLSSKHQPSTNATWGSVLHKHLLPRFGDRRLCDITPMDISEFMNEARARVMTNTLHSFYTLLRLLFDLAEQLDLIERSPVRSKLHRPETARVDKPTLSAEQIREILRNMESEQARLFTLLLAVTGIRMGEAMALRWMDFDAKRLELVINHTLYRSQLKAPKTENSRRTVRLVPAVAELIASHKMKSGFQADTDFLFCRPDGLPLCPTSLRLRLRKAMDRAGIKRVARKHGFHIFRHTAGTLLYSRSRDLKLVQGTLGHSNISTTSDIYVHLDDKVSAEGAEILAEEILTNCDLTVTQRSKMVS